MATRFTSENFTTKRSVVYQVQIEDTSFSGSSTEFTLAPNGFDLRFEGENSNRFAPVIPANCTLQMMVENSTHAAFITDLTAAAEERFKLRVFRNGSFYWAGVITPDIGTIEDRHYPYIHTVTATDMGRLGAIPFNDDGDPYTGFDTQIAIIQEALSKTGLLTYGWGAGSTCITTVDQWYEDSMTTGTNQDPLALTRNEYRAFWEIDNNGVYKYKSCLEVLQEILRSKGCTLRQSAGAFRIIQVPQWNNATVTERRYDRDGAFLSAATGVNYTATIDQTETGGAKLTGTTFSWLPALREISLKYAHRSYFANYIPGASWSHTSSTIKDGIAAINSVTASTTIHFGFTFAQSITNSASTAPDTFVVLYKATLKVGNKFLKRNCNISGFNIVYGNTTWSDAPSFYFFHRPTAPQPNSTTSNNEYYFIETPPLQSAGNIEAQIQFDSFRRMTDGSVFFPASITVSWNATSASVQVFTFDTWLTEASDLLYKVTNTTSAFLSANLELTTQIGDGYNANSSGHLEVYDGAAWQQSSQWQVDGAGTKYSLIDLLLLEMMAGQKTPVKTMRAKVYSSDFQAHYRLDDGTNVWAFMGGTYSARMEEWDGEWFFLQRSTSSITVQDPVPTAPTGPTPTHQTVKNPIVVQTQQNQSPSPAGVLNPFTQGVTVGSVTADDAISQIVINNPVNAGAFTAGDQVAIINPVTGSYTTVTVTQTTVQGDTTINVSGYNATGEELPEGSYIVKTGANNVIEGIGVAGSGSESNNPSNWWDIFQQWWTVDDSLDIEYPIQAQNIVLETNENAGNGSTAGFRLDGDGIQSFTATSATPTAKILDDGTFDFRTHPNAGNGSTAGVIVSKSGGVKGYGASSSTPQNGFGADGSCLIREDFLIETEELTGDGSTAGLRWDTTDGLSLFKNTSATPVLLLKSDGRIVLNHDGHPTITTGIFYVNDGVIWLDHDGNGTKVHPQYGHIVRLQILDYNEAWSASFVGRNFIRFTSEYNGLQLYKVGYSLGAFAGSGAGSNTFDVKHITGAGATTTLASLTLSSGTKSAITAIGSPQNIATDDMIVCLGSSISATPAQGLYVDLYLRKQ